MQRDFTKAESICEYGYSCNASMPLPMHYHYFYGCSLAVMCTLLIPRFPDLYVYALHTAASPHKQP